MAIMPLGMSVASINPDTQSTVENAGQQLAQCHEELVDIFNNPPQDIDVTADKNEKLKPEDCPLMFSIKIPTDDGKTRIVNISYIRDPASPIPHAIILEGATKDDTHTPSAWQDYIILSDGTLPGYANGETELKTLQSAADCCKRILKAVSDKKESSPESMTILET